jgi:putative endopeptidase
MGIPAVFGFFGGTDLKNSKMVIANARQGGLSMPNKDYYLAGDTKFQKTRDEFRGYMKNMFMLVGDKEQDAVDNAFTVMRIQNRLADSSLRSVELRDPEKR